MPRVNTPLPQLRTVLFATYGGGHAHMVIPVAKLLENMGMNSVVLAMPAAKAIIAQSGLRMLDFTDLLEGDAEATAYGQELAAIHHSPTIGVELEDSVAYLGLCFKDLVQRYGREGADALMAEKGRHAFFPVSVMERLLDKVKPDMVVTTNSPRSEAAAIAVAKGRGLPTLIMTDLFSGMPDYVMQAQHITFLNDFARDMSVANGLADPGISQLHLTGNPAFDKLLTLPRQLVAGWMEQHVPGAAGRKTVLHADMPAYVDVPNRRSHIKTDEEIAAEMEACWQAAQACGAVYLVRPHPSQNRAFYAEWVEGRPHAHLAAECDLHELLIHADVLVCRSTTVGLEAAYLGCRIVQLEPQTHADMPLHGMGVAWGAGSYGELAQSIKIALDDNKQLEEIHRNVKQRLPSEAAADKIAAIIAQQLSTPHE